MEILTRATLDNLQLDVKLNFPDAATFIGLSGPSGAGKTTLLRCLAGLSKNAEASGHWGQHVIGKVRTGLVFQDSLLFPHLSVGQNLLMAADFARQQSFHFDEVVLGCKCNHLIARMPDSLSGGEAQRVAIARAILNSPSILLLDEPVSAMDNVLKHDVLKYLASLSRTSLKMLMVSHDLRELALYTDHMAWLERGTVIHQGQTDSVMSDLTVSLPGFEQRFTVFKGVIEEHLEGQNCYALRCEGQLIYARNPVVNGKQALLTIDARDISIDREQASASSIVNGMTCTVDNISKAQAGQLMFTLSAGSTRIFALISQLSQERLQFQQGETVTARFKLR